MNIIAIIQARMGSSRLPGKVLKRLGDRTVLAHVVQRLQRVPQLSQIVIATTDLTQDDAIAEESIVLNTCVFRGSEWDVLSRYYEAALLYKADAVVRITSDCPFIDPEIVNEMISIFHQSKVDYINNFTKRTFPRGLDAELFTMNALQSAHDEATHVEHREHVTPYIYQNPHRFSLACFTSENNYSEQRWTLDTPEDWDFIHEVYSKLKVPGVLSGWKDILRIVEKNPELLKINAHIEQKKLETNS
ncbi:glycosyltransferase family protein [Paenibacillus athensensis]|uniref:Acylneuraminate cytidylyltransferase n=1 Tax=Paenibacillus athensensis TaxID=1967502 RepID=A0A4Y8Q4F3_9BACL|nr:glycosyltransferase family protein [Paenibacillus athensensis]MCD1260833.1 glycosyltransferase family protein [Paenibacillus athensensis]